MVKRKCDLWWKAERGKTPPPDFRRPLRLHETHKSGLPAEFAQAVSSLLPVADQKTFIE
jgi:hypothetical protein